MVMKLIIMMYLQVFTRIMELCGAQPAIQVCNMDYEQGRI